MDLEMTVDFSFFVESSAVTGRIIPKINEIISVNKYL